MSIYGYDYFVNNKISILESSLNDEINTFTIMMESNEFIVESSIIDKIRIIWNKFKRWIKEIWNKIYNTKSIILRARNKALKSKKYINNLNEYSKNSPLSIRVLGFENRKAKSVSNASEFGNFIFNHFNINDNLLEALYKTLDGYSRALVERTKKYIDNLSTNSLDNRIELYSKDDSYIEDNTKDLNNMSEDFVEGLNILKYITCFNIRNNSDLDSNNIYYLGNLQLDDINNYYRLFNYTEELREYYEKILDIRKIVNNTISIGENVLNKNTIPTNNDKVIQFYINIIKNCMKELSNLSNTISYLIEIFTSTIIYNYNACYIINSRNN